MTTLEDGFGETLGDKLASLPVIVDPRDMTYCNGVEPLRGSTRVTTRMLGGQHKT